MRLATRMKITYGMMVNDRRFYSDTFWFTLFHEIGHIINGDYFLGNGKD